jgi:hypothetical protein
MIDDNAVQRAVDWLLDNAAASAKARADRVLLDEMTKVIKARLMRQSKETSLAAQERDALASDEYETHLRGLAVAVELDEKYRAQRAAADARLECWRTLSSNARTIGKVG